MGRGRGAGEGAVLAQSEMGVVEQRARAVPAANLHAWGVCRVQGDLPKGFLVGRGCAAAPCPSCARLPSLQQALEG